MKLKHAVQYKPVFARGARSCLVSVVCAAILVAGCASTPRNPDDPFESYNRFMFSFNEGVDKAVTKPAARVYETVAPRPVKTGVHNFFSNLTDPWVGLNNLLQGKPGEAFSDWMRFLFNTTFGIAGLLDIASEAGLPRHDEDFGQTLAVWGVGDGPFVVLPFFGPRMLRDAAATPLDFAADGISSINHVPTRNSTRALNIVQTRTALLPAERALEGAALDRYAYIRDFHMQQRRYKIHDGRPPVEYEDFSGVGTPGVSGGMAAVAAEAAVSRLELVEPMALGPLSTAPLPRYGR